MGNTQSSPAKDETRRSNRLTKPLTKKLALGSLQVSRPEDNSPELASGLIGWQNPWVGSLILTEIRSNETKTTEKPPTSFQSEPASPEQSAVQTLTQSWNDVKLEPISPSSGSLSASASVRRASYQPGTLGNYSQISLAEQPKRANSIQAPPSQRHRSVIYEDFFEDATSSNTAFLVGNQRFSLTRRRSLLTRPGVATRRTNSAIRRVPSPIGEPEAPTDDLMESQRLQGPLHSRQRLSEPISSTPSPARAMSPADSKYTQLGALKLGSLRVVNGAASPCPSERIPLGGAHASGPGLGLKGVGDLPPRQSTLEIPSVSDVRKADDAPGSPFSFEKSPVVAVPPQSKSLFHGDSEDEGIAMCDDGSFQLEQNAMDAGTERSVPHSLNKSDSGYSSATSVRSLQQRARASFDSQSSNSCGTDSTKASWISGAPSYARSGDQGQRHPSPSRTNSKNFSQLHPDVSRWYDCRGPTAGSLGRSRSGRSTLRAPRSSEYPLSDDLVPVCPELIPPTAPRQSPREKTNPTRGPHRDDRLSMSVLDATSLSSFTATSEKRSSYHQALGTDAASRRFRSASENRSRENPELSTTRSRSRSRHSSRIWSHRSGVELPPPLPTILSPDHLNAAEEREIEYPLPDARRGRLRSRSQDHRRHKLMKARPQTETFL